MQTNSSVNHHIIFIPGLKDNDNKTLAYRFFAFYCKRKGITLHFFKMGWQDNESFDKKLQKLIKLIDDLATGDNKVGLIGSSAGGSVALNAFAKRSDNISKVINICGRLRAGQNVRPSLEQVARKSLAFKESVLTFEKIEPSLTKVQRQKVITIRGIYDEIVPVSTIPLEGAVNKKILCIEHSLSIRIAFFSIQDC
ncbi:hypothetical protein A2Y26_00095 [candidate division CPR2 bacterium GWD2_39_7]|nr:MAG: hypothetical protein A2Y27_02250 [candidate division CPR2 bacterium GWD1_39_7]OGB70363.1 MAG: hypothetical protein A2Y26_00095 [candidate division CPR2 bacterium GWD2_39_7]